MRRYLGSVLAAAVGLIKTIWRSEASGSADPVFSVRPRVDVPLIILGKLYLPVAKLPVETHSPKKFVEFVVDTGAAYSLLPGWTIAELQLHLDEPTIDRPDHLNLADGKEVEEFGWKRIRVRVGEEALHIHCAILGPTTKAGLKQMRVKDRKAYDRFRKRRPLLGRFGFLEKYTVILNANRGLLRRNDADDWWDVTYGRDSPERHP